MESINKLIRTGEKLRDIAILYRNNAQSRILEHVHKGTIGTVYSLLDGEYEFIEAKILEKSELLNKSIKEKGTNIILAYDKSYFPDLLNLLEEIHPYIIGLKIHHEIIYEYDNYKYELSNLNYLDKKSYEIMVKNGNEESLRFF